MKPFALALTAGAVLACPLYARATTSSPLTSVYISCQSKGESTQIGNQICTALLDEVAKSPRFTLVSRDTGKGFRMDVYVVNGSLENYAVSSVAVGWASNGGGVMYYTNEVLVTGADKAAFQASGILALVDSIIQDADVHPRG